MSKTLPLSIEAMLHDSQAPTGDLDDFIKAYGADDNLWWVIGCGHHQNLFDAAVEAATFSTSARGG